MAGYLIVTMKSITDLDRLQEYRKAARITVEKFGGKLICNPQSRQKKVEGADHTGIIVFKFPSYETLEEWYYSDEYQEVIKIRLGAVDADITLVEGSE